MMNGLSEEGGAEGAKGLAPGNSKWGDVQSGYVGKEQ